MTTGDKTGRRSLSEAVQEPRPKPALGPPHDTYATVGITLAFAGALFSAGRTSVVTDALGWTGMIVSFAVAIAVMFYFQRAYGFGSRGWGNAPMGAGMSAMFGFMVVLQLVPAALYGQYFQESLLGYSMACLALAMFTVGILRAALGKASPAERADQTAPRGEAAAEMRSTPEEPE